MRPPFACLNATLADLGQGGYDQLVCLGDAIQGDPPPAEVVALLAQYAD